MVAPIIPQLTDKDIEAILEAAAAQRRDMRRLDDAALPFEVQDAVPRLARRSTTRCAPST